MIIKLLLSLTAKLIKKQRFKATLLTLVLLSFPAISVEQTIKGIVDARLTNVSTVNEQQSFLSGGYGKFDVNQGLSYNLAQLGVQYKAEWENNLSFHLVANGFANNAESSIGISESYISYKGLPSDAGWRFKGKLGLFYPNISQENGAVAWSNPYTLNNSTINSWIGEELRNTGFQLTVENLGKFRQSQHNFSLDFALFKNNDPAGAMLAWHGWTSSSRQTLIQEKLTLQNFPARQPGEDLATQAPYSDPFLELDDRWGGQVIGHWRYSNKIKFSLGYYDNNSEKNFGIVEKGQYTWSTKFNHFGLKAKLWQNAEIIGQYMHGRTYMLATTGGRVVDTPFTSAFLMLRQHWQQHHLAIRVEQFSVDDLDTTWGDSNQEEGKGLTLSYRYRLSKQSFIQTEYNWLDSERFSRSYVNQPINLTENMFQLAYRYYFNQSF